MNANPVQDKEIMIKSQNIAVKLIALNVTVIYKIDAQNVMKGLILL